MRIQEMPVAILVWTQEGCPACEDFMPKFLAIAEEYSNCLPIIIADVAKFPGAADVFRVQSTPSTMITRYGRRGFAGFIEGDAPEERIRRLFAAAGNGLDCQV
jgi:thioredoxin-like negative regulator of GroEL